MAADDLMQADQAGLEKQIDAASKRDLISTACREGNLDALVGLANSNGGLLDDAFRATACKCSCSAIGSHSRLNYLRRASIVRLYQKG